MPVLPYPPITQWGHPSSSKRALCLHPMSGSSQIWHFVADALVAEGYVVTAPDLIGHGLTPSTSTDYSVKAYADNLLPFLSATGPYDVVIGGSWGSIVTLAILPHISDARRIVMVDPPLELSNDTVDEIRNLTINDISNTMTVDENMKLMNWVKDVAVWRGLARQLCRVAAAEGTCQHNKPWSFTHLLPGPSPTQEMMILAADPSVWALFTQEEAAELKRTHPHIKMKLVKGAGHAMILQVPYRNVIIEAALGTVEVDA